MNFRIHIFSVVGLSAGLLAAGCSSNNGSSASVAPTPPPSPPPATAQDDTAQVLSLAQQTSETTAPFAVNGGALTITGTSETTAPVPVN
jgi:hypothetical protein